jgi:hypothetical protein
LIIEFQYFNQLSLTDNCELLQFGSSTVITIDKTNFQFAHEKFRLRPAHLGGFSTGMINKMKYYTSNSNCPMKKQHLYHVIMWFFTVFRSNSWFRNAAWDTITSHGRSTVGYYSIPRSRVTRGHNFLKQYGVRELLFVISYRRFDLTKDFQDVCYL